jgi:hypothetical protein
MLICHRFHFGTPHQIELRDAEDGSVQVRVGHNGPWRPTRFASIDEAEKAVQEYDLAADFLSRLYRHTTDGKG